MVSAPGLAAGSLTFVPQRPAPDARRGRRRQEPARFGKFL
jgi:hypothetical protein